MENNTVGEDFKELPRGEQGELLVRGPFGQVYQENSEKQKQAVINGWNRPGLYMYQDEDGCFWYLSRIDDIIVTSGYKIPGGEVENAINAHHAVLESAVVPSPAPVLGSVIKLPVLECIFNPLPASSRGNSILIPLGGLVEPQTCTKPEGIGFRRMESMI